MAASFNTPELFSIAQDLTDMRVIADIDEADIGGVKEGQRVSFTVDAFPDDHFEGQVTQVRQQATTESNVVTYEVVISAPNKDLKLKPGLTANVTIFTMEKNDVMSVPSKALRFIPTEALLEKGQTISDCEGEHKLWTLEDNTFKAHKVEIGTSNGMVTEIISGIPEGTEILTDFKISGGMPEESQQATTESNVVTYEVVISARNNDLKLKPGLTANVTIFTLEKNGVLVAPAKALRFMPNEALLQEGQTIEDVEAPLKLWTKEGNVFKAHKVETGTTNGVLTEITSGIAAGTEVLVDFTISGGPEMPQGQQATNPFMPRPGRNNNRQQGGNQQQRR